MEPVPETESMEGFKPSPLPTLRLPNLNTTSKLNLPAIDTDSPSRNILVKPQALRRSTDPIPSSPKSPSSWFSGGGLPYRPRTTSPLSGSAHSRSRSTASLAPPMSRTQSMPGVNGAGHILFSPQMMIRPASPSGSPSRVRKPRKPMDEMFPPTSPIRTSVLEPSERRITERNSSPNLGVTSQQTVAVLRHRRPTSPLRQYGSASAGSLIGMSGPTPAASGPSQRSYESFPTGYGTAASVPPSSVPSTPTSTRSRSPSISSLETIPDSPDAEEAALEAERLAQLQAEAEAAENSENSDSSDSRSRNSLDVPRGRTLGFGSKDKRKRWSVCGAERRGDIDLETIWED